MLACKIDEHEHTAAGFFSSEAAFISYGDGFGGQVKEVMWRFGGALDLPNTNGPSPRGRVSTLRHTLIQINGSMNVHK